MLFLVLWYKTSWYRYLAAENTVEQTNGDVAHVIRVVPLKCQKCFCRWPARVSLEELCGRSSEMFVCLNWQTGVVHCGEGIFGGGCLLSSGQNYTYCVTVWQVCNQPTSPPLQPSHDTGPPLPWVAILGIAEDYSGETWDPKGVGDQGLSPKGNVFLMFCTKWLK